MHSREEKLAAFGRLLDIMDDLREKCPWDHKQTFDSLRENTIEETYELATAISRHDMTEISKELGDVLLHVVFYAKMGSETGDFDIADVCNRLCDKLIFRHPHVYRSGSGAENALTANVQNAEEVSKLWEQVKLKEKDGNKTVLGGIPDSLPSLVKAYRIQDKVANVGFDWERREDVWEKVKEEIREFEQEVQSDKGQSTNDNGQCSKEMTEEFGDLMFALINAARLYKIRPDNALELTNLKFTRRFNYIESRAKEQGKALKDMSLDEMEALWQEAKDFERRSKI
ncbi:MAG: nucleoside triphosphate pyrophosphohydrolase [Paludibacteraceae bacterium]|nr:nucleoside triphosphate pyrophosphohydrolase [Paludibacteraceae bacterium]